jgi:O-antigen/teichoic acid export membrane protein
VLFPRLAVLAHARDAAGAALVDRATRVTVLLQLPAVVVLACGAEPLLTLWLGGSVAAQAAPILRWLLVGCLANTAAQVPFAHLQASGRSWLTARFHLAQLAPYALFLYWAATRHGALGAAWAWSARCAVDALLLLAATAAIERPAVSLRSLVALGAGLAATLCAAAGGAAAAPGAAWPWILAAAAGTFSGAVILRRAEWADFLRRAGAARAVGRAS